MQQEPVVFVPYKNCIGDGHTKIPSSQMDESKTKKFDLKVNWNDIESVNRLKHSVNKLLLKSSSEGVKEDDIYSMFTSSTSAMELIEHLRFGKLSLLCDIRLDPYGRRSYHTRKKVNIQTKNTSKTAIKVDDIELDKEIHNVISALTRKQLDLLRSKVAFDMEQNKDDGSQIYQYVNHIIAKRDYRTKVKSRLSRAGDALTKPEPTKVQKTLEVKSTPPKQFSPPVQSETLQEIQKQHKSAVFKLQEIIQRKNDEIQNMIALNVKHTELIRTLSKEEEMKETKEEPIHHDKDDVDEYVQIVKDIKNGIIHFKADYNVMKVDAIPESDTSELINKLNKYSQTIESICVYAKQFRESIDAIKKHINDKYVPKCKGYKEWKLDDIMSWINSLENGRFVKHLDTLLFGFKESEITNGELLPDLSVGDLSVSPFNMNNFKDKRDLIRYFKDLNNE